jgi:hypothetical protein
MVQTTDLKQVLWGNRDVRAIFGGKPKQDSFLREASMPSLTMYKTARTVPNEGAESSTAFSVFTSPDRYA